MEFEKELHKYLALGRQVAAFAVCLAQEGAAAPELPLWQEELELLLLRHRAQYQKLASIVVG